jgi:hypothetical protein
MLQCTASLPSPLVPWSCHYTHHRCYSFHTRFWATRGSRIRILSVFWSRSEGRYKIPHTSPRHSRLLVEKCKDHPIEKKNNNNNMQSSLYVFLVAIEFLWFFLVIYNICFECHLDVCFECHLDMTWSWSRDQILQGVTVKLKYQPYVIFQWHSN